MLTPLVSTLMPAISMALARPAHVKTVLCNLLLPVPALSIPRFSDSGLADRAPSRAFSNSVRF